MKKKESSTGIFVLITFIAFILLFTYLSLNLKNLDYGYELQELVTKEKRLKEEIDILKAKKARLMSLEEVERKVLKDLKYQYPRPEQFIKVFEE
jgi:hypothetical protein